MRNQILYGGDYNPDQWLDQPEILAQDLEYMKEAGVNTVSMGMFSWASLEPREGEYCFEWLEEIMMRLYQNGISTILSTPSGARPKWLADQYPEVLRVGENRVRNLFGGRHNHCYTSPVYREKVKLINTALAGRFASSPAVVMWHISNEYGGECHCPLCQQAFQTWLKCRYTDIGELNRGWCTAFWSHTYQSFDQIESPSSIGESALHALTLNWKRFVTEQTADFLEHEIRALRENGASQPTTVNLMYDYQGLNYDRLAECVDIISWDSYPLWHKGEDILTARDNGMQHDYMRSLKHQPFLLMESCPSATNWQGVSKLKKPGMLTAASLQAIAHGSDSVLYFQIRQSRGASEKFHGAVIDHYGGNDTRVYQEVKAIGTSLSELAEIHGSIVNAEAALIYDVENHWALDGSQGPRNDGMYNHEAVMKSYRALKKAGINVDIISESQDISKYKLVVAPLLYMFREGIEEQFRSFTAGGGHLAVTYWTGIVDGSDRCFLGGTPHGLMDVFGIRRAETDSLFDDEKNILLPASQGSGANGYQCFHLCDLLELHTAESLFEYGSDFYQGTPAVTRNKFDKGVAYYIGADAEQQFYDDFYSKVLNAAGVSRLVEGEIPEGIEVCSRTTDEHEYVFVQNYNRETVDITSLQLDGMQLYGDEGTMLGPYGTLIMKRQLR
ncbi:MAG: beta-galactosidase [Lachnospiraceae bacterium]